MKWCLLDFNKIDENTEIQSKWQAVARNTGNLVFMYSLKKILDVKPYTWREAAEASEQFDGIITTSLIWLRECDELESAKWLLDKYKDKPIVPISVGLQAPTTDYKFKFTDKAVNVLKEIEERAVIGVRGEYTAEILNSHNIKNIQVIGCPSVYYNLDDFAVQKKELTKVKAVMQIYSSAKEEEIFSYAAKNAAALIMQTRGDEDMVKKYSLHFKEQKLFFDAEEWMRYVCDFDFSLGARFHGGVMAVINGVPSLFVTVDSRTEEMCRFFKFPSVDIKNFDASKSVEEYYEMADYTEFNRNYSAALSNFRSFCDKNKIICFNGGKN